MDNQLMAEENLDNVRVVKFIASFLQTYQAIMILLIWLLLNLIVWKFFAPF